MRPVEAVLRPHALDSADAIRNAVAGWYRAHARPLAFRAPATTPFGVLVSEVMAQQTQVARVEPVWTAFVARFPAPAQLAAAPTSEVLRAWAGLGYNRRAVLLQRAARTIVDRHAGVVPRDIDALERLPGVGRYTARAVAAIAYGVPVGAVDTNVARVLGRLLAGHGHHRDPGPGMSPRRLQQTADALVDSGSPADWSHALMDIGATVCRPAPECRACPLRRWCLRAELEAVPLNEPGTAGQGRREPRARARRFEQTSRWLRGRLVRMLGDAPADTWVAVAAPLGGHDAQAIETALRALERDGLVQRDRAGRARLPS